MSTRSYSLLASLALFILALFLFLGPEIKEKPEEKEAKLWEEDWQLVEYYPSVETEETQKKTKLRFLRYGALERDRYYIESQIEEGKKGKRRAPEKNSKEEAVSSYKRWIGNHFVKNIFSDWYAPKLLAYYKLGTPPQEEKKEKKKSASDKKQKKSDSPEKESPEKKSLSLKEAGIEESSSRLFFYKGRDTSKEEPFILTIGKRLSNRRILVHLNKEPELIFALPKHLFNNFDKSPMTFRNRDILHLSREAHIKSIRARIETEKKYFLVEQKKSEDKKGAKDRWSFKNLNKSEKKSEFSRGMGLSLENALKQLKINYFADDESVEKFPPVQELWRDAKKNFLEIEVKTNEGRKFEILLRKPKTEIQLKEELGLALIKEKESEDVNFVEMKKLDRFVSSLESIKNFIRAQKEREKHLKRAAEKKAQESKNAKKKP